MATNEWVLIPAQESGWGIEVWRHPDGREVLVQQLDGQYRTSDAWGVIGRSGCLEMAQALCRQELTDAEILKVGDDLAERIATTSVYEPQSIDAALRYLSARHIAAPRSARNACGISTRRKPSYAITLVVEGSIFRIVEQKAKAAFGDTLRTVTKVQRYFSRTDEFALAQSKFADAREIIEGLRDDLEEWLSNMPEQLRDGSKASELDQAISELQGIADALGDVDFGCVEFPDMCG